MFVELALGIQEFRSLIPVTAVCTPFPWHTITIIRVVYIWGAEWPRFWSTSSYPLPRKLFIPVVYKERVPSKEEFHPIAQ